MAESIALLFRTVTWDELRAALAALARPGREADVWTYPDVDDHSLILYRYDTEEYDLFRELETWVLARARADLGQEEPSAILVLELRRSTGARAWADAAKLSDTLLQRFSGMILDDSVRES